MSLRARLTLSVALAVAAAVAIACVVVYVIVRGDLRGQVDDTLRLRAEAAQIAFDRPGGGLVRGAGGGFFAHLPSLGQGGGDTLVQLVESNGDILRAPYSRSRSRSTVRRGSSPPARPTRSSRTRRWAGCTSVC